MLKMTVHDLENDRISTRFGSERELLEFLKLHYPVVSPAYHLDDAVQMLNDGDLFKVFVEPYVQDSSSNLLPDDYLTADQGDDPWPRAGDVEV